jgi:hypothetical protein
MKPKYLFLIALSLVVSIQLSMGQTKSRVFDFPIRPGTKEWLTLGSYVARLNSYNIPDELIKNMNTADLVKTCLNYPEFRLIMTRSSLQQGYDYLKSIFNGFRELEKRTDTGKELIIELSKINPSDVKEMTESLKIGEFMCKFTNIEIILAQYPVLMSLDQDGKKELSIRCISLYETIEKLSNYYGTFGLATPAFVLARLLNSNNYQNFINEISKDKNLRSFVDNAIVSNKNSLSKILLYSKGYLNQLLNK